mmetsp:Transcript_10318/g.29414  ORF Transcript_10318/g.29414 Transcript_10318/m.29414 type:complete len:304 (-) Transcript_10318:318-1229(-)
MKPPEGVSQVSELQNAHMAWTQLPSPKGKRRPTRATFKSESSPMLLQFSTPGNPASSSPHMWHKAHCRGSFHSLSPRSGSASIRSFQPHNGLASLYSHSVFRRLFLPFPSASASSERLSTCASMKGFSSGSNRSDHSSLLMMFRFRSQRMLSKGSSSAPHLSGGTNSFRARSYPFTFFFVLIPNVRQATFNQLAASLEMRTQFSIRRAENPCEVSFSRFAMWMNRVARCPIHVGRSKFSRQKRSIKRRGSPYCSLAISKKRTPSRTTLRYSSRYRFRVFQSTCDINFSCSSRCDDSTPGLRIP